MADRKKKNAIIIGNEIRKSEVVVGSRLRDEGLKLRKLPVRVKR